MRTVSSIVIGHFSFKQETFNGQTIKTKILADSLSQQLGKDEVKCVDTHGGIHFLMRSPMEILNALQRGKNIIILPAYRGIRVIVPLLVILNMFFRRRLHYVVIGGWLPFFVERKPLLRYFLKKIDYIYVETNAMAEALKSQKFSNVIIMPNFKQLDIVDADSIKVISNEDNNLTPSSETHTAKSSSTLLKLCTFSRVSREKGIEDAVRAVNRANELLHENIFSLDIYGQIEDEQWFAELMSRQPGTIQYCGTVPFSESTHYLSKYFLLLFPTFYPGEGFPGTLIDAMAAGLPVFASDWKANKEIVVDGVTGRIFPARNVQKLADILIEAAQNVDSVNTMRGECIKKAYNYLPERVICILTDRLNY